jgi:hypothetical protein
MNVATLMNIRIHAYSNVRQSIGMLENFVPIHCLALENAYYVHKIELDFWIQFKDSWVWKIML